ncbi:tetratricopeptide repeat-containing sulfotransferase family protein [Frateuria sp. GZRe12]|uniref:tetratricopeptide repeat-containing sulfotransferase family protein n=1 Tax=Frateuria sp. GZRe12 TaxID=3351533 RepID=UPI003EDC15BF
MNATTDPRALEQLRARARSHVQAHQLAQAQALLEAIIQQAPHDLAASIDLADVLFRQGRLQASTAPLLQAARRLPRNAPLIIALVQHLIARGEVVAARAALDLLALAPDPPAGLLVAQANLRFALGEVAVAKALMDKAMAAGASAPEERHLYAMLLQFSGDIDGACRVLEECLRRWPAFGDAAMVLANLQRQRPESNRLEQWREQLDRLPAATAGPAEAFVRAEFEYALFKTLDDLGRHDEAWPALERCNALMHRLNPYDAAAEVAVTDALIRMPVRRIGTATSDGPTPIFIVGMPRSGTTLLDRILSSHSRVTSAGEIIDFWRQLHWVADVVPAKAKGLLHIIGRSSDIDYRALGARYLAQTQWRAQGRDFYIDKLPANIQLVSFIRRALPHAPILHMVREPMDTCFSNFKAMFGNVSPYSYDLEALAHHHRQYERLARHWHDGMPGAMLDVSYADLVQYPAATIGRVLTHCGLAVEDACLRPERNAAPVATPSSAQVRESIHTRGLGQWQLYERQLEPLRMALAAGDS